jgi:hypothetical protein
VFAQLTDIVHRSKDPVGINDITFSFVNGGEQDLLALGNKVCLYQGNISDQVNDVKQDAIKGWANYGTSI